MGVRKVVVHIDRLVLNGIPKSEREEVASGLRRHLAELLADQAIAHAVAEVGHIHRLPAPPVRISAAGAGQEIGKRAAGSIVSGVTG